MTHAMIIRTETVNAAGRQSTTTERIPHIMTGELDRYREAARVSAPRGSTRTIRVVDER